jgi:hypothetical protein
MGPARPPWPRSGRRRRLRRDCCRRVPRCARPARPRQRPRRGCGPRRRWPEPGCGGLCAGRQLHALHARRAGGLAGARTARQRATATPRHATPTLPTGPGSHILGCRGQASAMRPRPTSVWPWSRCRPHPPCQVLAPLSGSDAAAAPPLGPGPALSGLQLRCVLVAAGHVSYRELAPVRAVAEGAGPPGSQAAGDALQPLLCLALAATPQAFQVGWRAAPEDAPPSLARLHERSRAAGPRAVR